MKTKLLTILILLATYNVYAQKGIINNGAKITITNGAILEITGNEGSYANNSFDASSHGEIDLDGKMKIQGNWINNATSGFVFVNRDSNGEVVFNGTALQLIGGAKSTYFEKLTLNNSLGLNLNKPTRLGGDLTLTSGVLNIGLNNLLLEATTSIQGTPSSSTMIVANSTGYVRKYFNGIGSFTFPVGDTTGINEYSPFEITFNTGSFNPDAYIQLNVTNSKHPNNNSSTHYINRFWSVSSFNISGFDADVTAFYNTADINGGATESNIYMAKYNDPYWNLLDAANTAVNTLTGNISSFSDFSGCESGAVLAEISIADNGINEAYEHSELITITLSNDDFVASLDEINWTLNNLPDGVEKGILTRVGNKSATIELTGNRIQDFDSDHTSISLIIQAAELVNSTSLVSDSDGITIIADNDAESISIADDGSITEGSEDGEVITVTAIGGTFPVSINEVSWTLTNMPTGVSKGIVLRINETVVEITLSGNASADYDTDITNTTLVITNTEIDEYIGANLSINTGVTFKAIDESLTISMIDDGSILEGSEDSETIEVTISGRIFHTPLSENNWSLSNLPKGVSIDSVHRDSDTHATITLQDNTTTDYDTDITNATLVIAVGEIDGYGLEAVVTTGVEFTANNDVESIVITDDGTLEEGFEDTEIITVSLINGTFTNPININKWTINNLPVGVEVGSIVRNSSTEALITLSGNRNVDYDTDITNLTIGISTDEIDDTTGVNLIANTGVTFIADVSEGLEIIALAFDGSISEGNENDEIITITLSDGTFVDPIVPSNWVISNQPTGVGIGTVARISETEVKLTLSGNATDDYDANITNFTVTINEAEIDDHTGSSISANTNVVFTATDEAVVLTLSDDGIIEGAEGGELITVAIVEDTFVSTLTAINWTITNLPNGVTKGILTRVSDDTVTIALVNNRIKDYDTDITNVTIEIAGAELIQHTGSSVSQNTGLIFDAVNDAESFTMTDDGEIIEDTESGEVITVNLSGGTFADPINPANWTLTFLPTGVSKGLITRIDETTATIELSGNTSIDYDVDITNATLSITDAEVDDYSGTALSKNTGITFTATIESINIVIADDNTLNEGAESGEVITVTITNDTFVDPINESNWSFTGLPENVSIGSVTRTGNTTASITLSGNRTKDYDTDITIAELTIKEDEFIAQSSDILQTGITFIADNDSESMTMIDDGEILEGAESGETITLTVAGGTFVENLTSTNWSITNQPEGVTLGSVFRSTTTTVELTLDGNTTSDYDVDIDNLTISVSDTEIDDYSGSDIDILSGVSFTAKDESLSISHAGLTEENLDGAEISLELYSDIFIDETLDNANFVLNNAPSGLTIDYIVYISETQLSVFLYFDNSDFDVDINNFNITVDNSELNGLANITSNDLLITASVEEIVVTIEDEGIYEGEEDGKIIKVVITEDEFVASLTPNNWVLQNLPQGVSKGSVAKISNDTVNITLSGNRTKDFDASIIDIQLDIAATELVNSSSPVTISSGVEIIAINDIEYLAISDDGISEGTEDSEIIYVSLFGGTFTNTLDPNNWTLNGLPDGVTKGSVAKIDSVSAQVTLVGNAIADYDEDIINMQLLINEIEIDEHTGSNISVNWGVTFVATNDEEFVTISDNGINEGTEDGEIITVSLTGGTFASVLSEIKWDFNNLVEGVEIGTINRIGNQTVELTLSGNRIVDYDDDITNFSVVINSDQIEDNEGASFIINNGVTFIAFTESVAISHAGLNEENLNGASVNLKLTNETFADASVDVANISLLDVPNGLTLSSISYVNGSEVNLVLDFDGTDFDSSFDNFHVQIDNTELSGFENLKSDTLSIATTDDEETITITDDGSITEGAEDGEQIQVTLSGGTFVANLDVNNWLVSNIPNGVIIGSIDRNSNTSVTLFLSGNATSDYDVSINDFTLNILPNEINDAETGSISSNTGVAFIAKDEILSINHAGLTESNLSGASIELSLTDEEFFDSGLTSQNFILNNAPPGLSVQSVTYNSSTTASLQLFFDNTDFDIDYTLFSISIDALELMGAGQVTSNILYISSEQEVQTAQIQHAGLTEENLDGASVIFSLIGDTFTDATIDVANFSLNGEPTGASINSITYINDTAVTIAIAYTGTDFDSDFLIFNISVSNAELVGSSGITSNSLNIVATNDTELLTMSYDGYIEEGTENDEVITVTLDGGTFASSINSDNWLIVNLPSGVTIGAISRISNTVVEIQLSGNADVDYDIDITNFEVQINESEVDDYLGVPIIINTGVIFTAIVEYEEKILTISNPNLDESTLNGASIWTELTADYLIDATVDLNNVILLNAPNGLTVKYVFYFDSVSFNIEFEFDGSDFDNDFSEFQILIKGSELNGAEDSTSNQLNIAAVIESQTIELSHAGLTENNLNNATLILSVVDESFVDNLFDITSFNLVNAPDTSSINSITYVNDTAAQVSVIYDGTDFDTDILDFGIEVSGVEFAIGNSIRSENLTITAINDDEILSMTDDGEIIERNIEGEIVTVTLTGGYFAVDLVTANWSFVNAPNGLVINNAIRISDTEVQLELGDNGISNFNSDITNLILSVSDTEINEHTGSNIEVATGITLTAIEEEVQITHLGVNEENLTSVSIAINLIDELFLDNILDYSNFELAGDSSISIGEVTYLSGSTAEITLLYSGQDFDNDKSITLHVSGYELLYSDTLISNSLTITATNDEEIFTMSDDGEILEGSEDGELISIVLSGGEFIQDLLFDNWIYSNMPEGVTVGSAIRLSDTEVNLILSGNSTIDYDTNLTQFSIEIPGIEFNDYTDPVFLIQGGVTFTALQENSNLTISHPGLNEQNIDGAILELDLKNAYFISGVTNISAITLNNEPDGLLVAALNIISDSTATVELEYGGFDFDENYNMFGITAGAEMLIPNIPITSNTVIIEAIIEPAVFVNFDGEILEGQENGEMIQIEVEGDKYISNVSINSIELMGLPQGVAINNLTRVSDTVLTINLNGTRIIDYDVDIDAIIFNMKAEVLQNFNGNNYSQETDIIFTAFNELLTINHDGLNEDNLDGAEVQLVLSEDWFIDNVVLARNINVFNAPIGTTVGNINYTNDSLATMILNFDGTDFSQDHSDFYIELAEEEIFGVLSLTSNSLLIEEGVAITDRDAGLDVNIYSTSGEIFVEIEDLPDVWESGNISIYSTDGRRIHFSLLENKELNKIKIDVKTANYFVKVAINGSGFTKKVFVILD